MLSAFPRLWGQEATQVIHLSLKQALERGPKANFEILLGREQLIETEQSQRRSRAELLPQVSLELDQSRSQTQYGSVDTTGNFGYHPVRYDNFNALLSASMSLFDVNNIATYRSAKINTEVARLDLNSTVQDILAEIAERYFTHQRNERAVETIDADIEADRVLLELAKNRLEAGAATEIDVTRAEVRLAANELRLAQQESALEESGLSIKRALNLDLGATLELDPVEVTRTTPAIYSPEDLQAAIDRSPEVAREARLLARRKLGQFAAKWERLPSVDLTGYWGYNGERFDQDLENIWSVELGISVPIFEGFRIDANRLEATSLVRSQETKLKQAEQKIESDMRLAMAQVRSRHREVEIARRQVELAEKELELSRVRFESGATDNTEVVQAQAGLVAARDGLIEAELGYNIAKLDLARAQGNVWTILDSSN